MPTAFIRVPYRASRKRSDQFAPFGFLRDRSDRNAMKLKEELCQIVEAMVQAGRRQDVVDIEQLGLETPL